MSENSKYQTLRAHLAFLRMTAAAEALPEALDHALKAKLSHQDFLERLWCSPTKPDNLHAAS